MGKHQQEGKTNATRLLDAGGVEYLFRTFECEEAMSGIEVADRLGLDRDRVFKTLVTQGKTGEHYVFMIPVASGLDLKKAAVSVGEKSIAMIRSRDLLPLTGYVHGGCSPLGMKKLFRTTVDETAQLHDTIMFSGGRIGCQIETTPEGLASVIPVTFADLTVV